MRKNIEPNELRIGTSARHKTDAMQLHSKLEYTGTRMPTAIRPYPTTPPGVGGCRQDQKGREDQKK